MQDAMIHLSLVSNVAAVTERMVAMTRFIFDEHASFAPVWQLARDDFIRKRAHEPRQFTIQNLYPTLGPIAAIKRLSETRSEHALVWQDGLRGFHCYSTV